MFQSMPVKWSCLASSMWKTSWQCWVRRNPSEPSEPEPHPTPVDSTPGMNSVARSSSDPPRCPCTPAEPGKSVSKHRGAADRHLPWEILERMAAGRASVSHPTEETLQSGRPPATTFMSLWQSPCSARDSPHRHDHASPRTTGVRHLRLSCVNEPPRLLCRGHLPENSNTNTRWSRPAAGALETADGRGGHSNTHTHGQSDKGFLCSVLDAARTLGGGGHRLDCHVWKVTLQAAG